MGKFSNDLFISSIAITLIPFRRSLYHPLFGSHNHFFNIPLVFLTYGLGRVKKIISDWYHFGYFISYVFNISYSEVNENKIFKKLPLEKRTRKTKLKSLGFLKFLHIQQCSLFGRQNINKILITR